ncbi:MAG: Fe-S cluster assembly protein SufB, partial [Liquorilactobacillus satsumensis]
MADANQLGLGGEYKYGFKDNIAPILTTGEGLTEETVRQISAAKNEPDWMLDFRLKAFKRYQEMELPDFGPDLSVLDLDHINYFRRDSDRIARKWEDVPADIKKTFDRLGVPEAERKYLAGSSAQYESEVVYHNMRKDFEDLGIVFMDTDSAVQEYPDLVRKYFGKLIPPSDNKFAALNSAVWSGGTFIYVPKGVRTEIPIQSYFRINAG